MSDDKKFHEYDGIIEHDNPLPTWWLWSFLLCIMFAALYFLHYVVALGPTLQDELKISMAQIEKLQKAAEIAAPTETAEALDNEFKKSGVVANGAAIFSGKCAVCHGQELQGQIGPNLTDNFWIHGKATKLDIVKVIREGVADKGMPPWGPVMKREEIYAVSAFILSKMGSHPTGAKAPQGDPINE